MEPANEAWPPRWLWMKSYGHMVTGSTELSSQQGGEAVTGCTCRHGSPELTLMSSDGRTLGAGAVTLAGHRSGHRGLGTLLWVT